MPPDYGVAGKSDGTCHYLFATVLEPDLVGAALDIPDEQIEIVTPEILRQAPESRTPAPPAAVGARSSIPETLSVTAAQNEKTTAPETVRVNIGLLDTLINLAGELVLRPQPASADPRSYSRYKSET